MTWKLVIYVTPKLVDDFMSVSEWNNIPVNINLWNHISRLLISMPSI